MLWQNDVAVVVMGVIASIPAFFAWRAWHKTDRLTLPRWRNVIGVINLATTAFVWMGVAVAKPLLVRVFPETLEIFWGWICLYPLSILALPCAFALKGRSRW